MNIQECDIMNALAVEPYSNQRMLAQTCGHSLGMINRALKSLARAGYLDEENRLTDKAAKEFDEKAPRNAVILAAGFGMRMVPINTQAPKALLEVHGEPLIERIIRQLHEVGIKEIHIVVGFLKEQFEYLIDEYDVTLIVNDEYSCRNNLHSMRLALDHLSNTYVIPCDIWCAQNPFHRHELYSWYMVSDRSDETSAVRVNRKLELVTIPESACGNAMIGICYLTQEKAKMVRERIKALDEDARYNDSFWEDALYDQGRMVVHAKVARARDVVEINTYEQLRELDSGSNQLQSNVIDVITGALGVRREEIVDIAVLKKGMTNRSFLFSCRGKKYIMRVPGEGTDQLINRRQEAAVYRVIGEKGICDDVVYIDPVTGYKITEFLPGARVCDSGNIGDLERCMSTLRAFHEMGLTVEHEFDIFGKIEFYESLWHGAPSAYKDYKETKEKVYALRHFIDQNVERKVLTHIDAVPDNFLLVEQNGKTDTRLIDWEYAGMQDPHVDIAMFCIYALYDKRQVDRLIGLYFSEGCPRRTKIKIYCYIAACGLLWSNWCEYKRNLGVEFGAYSLRQYRYAKEFYRIVQQELSVLDGEEQRPGEPGSDKKEAEVD